MDCQHDGPQTLEIHVTSLAGERYEITVDSTWTVLDLQKSVETASGIPRLEQRLVVDTRSLHSSMCLDSLQPEHGDGIDITLCRIDPELAKWFKTIDENPKALKTCPETLTSNRDLVLMAVEKDGGLLPRNCNMIGRWLKLQQTQVIKLGSTLTNVFVEIVNSSNIFLTVNQF